MATSYRVTAPYVLLKVHDHASGKLVVTGFYAGAVVSDEQVDKDSIKRHLAKNMIERVTAAAQSASSEFDPAVDRSPEELHKLKIEQLKAYADKREIGLGGATKKDEILAALATAEQAGQGEGGSGGDQGSPGSQSGES